MSCRVAITVQGIVQGVGFRPFVYNLAVREQLAGWVSNDSDAVRIEVQGDQGTVDRFVQALRNEAPRQARIDQLEVCPIEVEFHPAGTATDPFQIRKSRGDTGPSPTIPADLATCSECLTEIQDPHERRYRYPFTNCTNCGPRWSIITALPYDRSRTSMHDFPLCDLCQAEYDDPTDRRFHAQPIACPACGPQLELLTRGGRRQAAGDPALRQAAAAVANGQILAIRGLGGFQLIADARSQAAVNRLRDRKHRPDKPFAVMLADPAQIRQVCHLSDGEQQLLVASQAPIVLLPRQAEGSGHLMADSVAPGNPYLGVMLPYTPLHHLLMQEIGAPIVCTSGNRSEEPMAITTQDALDRLADIADLILTHNRPVVRPVDDSVVQATPEGVQVIRRARGYAPLPIKLQAPAPPILAVGGHLKNTVALTLGANVLISPHIGDLDSRLSVEAHQQAISDLLAFFHCSPEAIACDLHPDYRSTQVAERLAGDLQVPLLRVQHHHAHLLSVLAEHNLAGPVLGLVWDGTGYGLDGTVWGGEALLYDSGRITRMAHLRTFPLPGGDRAVREPRRTALGILYEMLGDQCRPLVARWFQASELTTLLTALSRNSLFPQCSSMGRLFDAVAACCGFDRPTSFEGQAAMALEFIADVRESDEYPLPVQPGQPMVVDWQPLMERLIADRQHGYSANVMSARFHRALASSAVAIAQQVNVRQVVLSGGCFQNRWLSKQVTSRLSETGFEVYTQREVPPGDGGIALGQIFGAIQQLGS